MFSCRRSTVYPHHPSPVPTCLLSFFPHTCTPYKWAPRIQSVYSTNISHYILFFKISLRQNSSITEHNEQIDSWKGHKILTMNLRQCNDGSKDNQGQLAPAGAKTHHIHFISISLQNFPITIADFIIVIIIMRFICIAFFKTSLTKCFPEKKRIKEQTKRRLLKKLQIH